jgi:hypothetical protein
LPLTGALHDDLARGSLNGRISAGESATDVARRHREILPVEIFSSAWPQDPMRPHSRGAFGPSSASS